MAFDCSNPFSLPAGVDLSSSQYCAVTTDSSGNLALPSAGGMALGILYTAPIITKAGEVYGPGSGIRKAKYGGTVTLPRRSSSIRRAGLSRHRRRISQLDPQSRSRSTQVRSTRFTASSSLVAPLRWPLASVSTTSCSVRLRQRADPGYLCAGHRNQDGRPRVRCIHGQLKRIVQSVAASTPVGTITGAFKTLAGAAATTLTLGTAVATIADFVWDGAAWRATSAITGTSSSLA